MLQGFNQEIFSFPFVNNKGEAFSDRESLLSYLDENFGHESSQALYIQTLLTAPLNLIYDPYTQDMIEKYSYCKSFNRDIAPDKAFEDLPCDWLDFVNLINGELPKIQKEKARRDGKKSK